MTDVKNTRKFYAMLERFADEIEALRDQVEIDESPDRALLETMDTVMDEVTQALVTIECETDN